MSEEQHDELMETLLRIEQLLVTVCALLKNLTKY